MRPRVWCLLQLVLAVVSGCASKAQFDVQDVASPYAYQYQRERGRIYHAATGREMTERQLYDYLAGFTVVYVGESHDSVDDHEVQLKVLRALAERFPGEVALGLEMLRTDAQEEVDRWVAGDMSEKDMMRLWADNWGAASYPYYRDILNFVREQGITLVALNRPRQDTSMRSGVDADVKGSGAPGPSAALLEAEPEIDWEDPYYDAYIGAFLSGHASSPELRQRFMRAQLLWDETMAQSAAEFLSQPSNQDRKLVIFAGGNHVRYGFGIPRRLFRRLPLNYAIVSPRVVDFPQENSDKLMDVELPDLPMPPADIIWMVGYEDLEQQRVKLGVSIAPGEEGGVLVQEVYTQSPAGIAGLAAGDTIRAIDGEQVHELFDLSYELGKKLPGDTGVITIERDSELLELGIEYENYAGP